MKKSRNAIILLVVLALLLGAYFILKKNKKSTAAEVQTEPTNAPITLIQNPAVINNVTLTDNDKKYTLVFDKNNNKWTLTSPQSIKAGDPTDILAEITAISARKIAEENASDLSKYGLSSPKVELTMKAADGTVYTFLLGNEDSTKDGYYLKTKENNNVYIVDSEIALTLKGAKDYVRDKTLFPIKSKDITSVALDKSGTNVFSANKVDDENWSLTSPIEGDADYDSINTINDALIAAAASSYIDENPKDLSKYGLDKPSYVLTAKTANGTMKLLLGKELSETGEFYGKMENSKEVFTVNDGLFPFLDKPLKEIVNVFAFIVKIDDVSALTVEMDGQTVNATVSADTSKKENDKFTVNGKDASMVDNQKESYFRNFFRSLIGITMDSLEIGAVPTGKPEITFTYTLKKAPYTMKVSFVSKDADHYYVLRNGKYCNYVVKKRLFDDDDGPRAALKKLLDAMNK